MLFWAKKTAWRGCVALLLLLASAYGLNAVGGAPLRLHFHASDLGLGVALWLAVLASDGIIHAALSRWGGAGYAAVGSEFRGYLAGMTPAACVVGGLIAGLGEEPLFRGVLLPLLSVSSPAVGLLTTAALFGAAHFVRPSLRLVAVWAGWQGFLLGGAYLLTGSLSAVIVAHFLHDTTAFLAVTRR